MLLQSVINLLEEGQRGRKRGGKEVEGGKEIRRREGGKEISWRKGGKKISRRREEGGKGKGRKGKGEGR